MATGNDKTTPSSAADAIRETVRTLRRWQQAPPQWLKEARDWHAKMRQLVADEEGPASSGHSPDTPPPPAPTPAPPPPPEAVPAAASSAKATAPELSPSAQWCCDQVRAWKAANKIREDIRISDLSKQLADELIKDFKADDTDTLRPLKWRYIKNELQNWGVWPLDRI
jgi:hypothetical protein